MWNFLAVLVLIYVLYSGIRIFYKLSINKIPEPFISLNVEWFFRKLFPRKYKLIIAIEVGLLWISISIFGLYYFLKDVFKIL
jgi:hypothetical protein